MTGGMTGTTDIISNISTLLPTGTYLLFQTLAPIFTNNGICHTTEKIMTIVLVFLFSVACLALSLTDSVIAVNGHHYYGIVTPRGLFNPQFKKDLTGRKGARNEGQPTAIFDAEKYRLNVFDVINSVLTVLVFVTLALLTQPLPACLFPHIPDSVIKTLPILIGLIVSGYFSMAPPPRKGVGNAVTADNPDVLPDGQTQGNGNPKIPMLSTDLRNLKNEADSTTATPATAQEKSTAAAKGGTEIDVEKGEVTVPSLDTVSSI